MGSPGPRSCAQRGLNPAEPDKPEMPLCQASSGRVMTGVQARDHRQAGLRCRAAQAGGHRIIWREVGHNVHKAMRVAEATGHSVTSVSGDHCHPHEATGTMAEDCQWSKTEGSPAAELNAWSSPQYMEETAEGCHPPWAKVQS